MNGSTAANGARHIANTPRPLAADIAIAGPMDMKSVLSERKNRKEITNVLRPASEGLAGI